MQTSLMKYTDVNHITYETIFYTINDRFNTCHTLNYDYHMNLIERCSKFKILSVSYTGKVKYSKTQYNNINIALKNIPKNIYKYIFIGKVKYEYLKYIAHNTTEYVWLPLFKYSSGTFVYEKISNCLDIINKYFPNWKEDLINLIKINKRSTEYNSAKMNIEYSGLNYKNGRLFFVTNEYLSIKELVFSFNTCITSKCDKFMFVYAKKISITNFFNKKYSKLYFDDSDDMYHTISNTNKYIYTYICYGKIIQSYNYHINQSTNDMWIPLLKYSNDSNKNIKTYTDNINYNWEYSTIKLINTNLSQKIIEFKDESISRVNSNDSQFKDESISIVNSNDSQFKDESISRVNSSYSLTYSDDSSDVFDDSLDVFDDSLDDSSDVFDEYNISDDIDMDEYSIIYWKDVQLRLPNISPNYDIVCID
jgi:hypothetical protein